MTVFGQDYAAIYDDLYYDHDFDGDIKDVTDSIAKYMDFSVVKRSLLDVGCGTGVHLSKLQNDYNVSGVDLSDAMLSICRNKLQVPLYQGDAKGFNIDRKFNVIIMMNAVLGYQSTNDDVKSTIANIKQHLLPGGLFIFDVWNGHSVLQERPTERVKQYSVGNASIVRVVRPRLALDKNLCTCEYTWYTHTSDSLTIRSENHRVRYFFNLELEAHLAYHGYKVLEARKPQRCINAPLAWHKLYVAQL